MLAATYFVDTGAVRALVMAVAMVALLVAATVAVATIATAVMPVVMGCCAVAAPVVGKLLVGVAVMYLYAVVFKP